GTLAFVGSDAQNVVVAFRGTQDPRTLDGVRNWLLNASIWLTEAGHLPGAGNFQEVGAGARFHRGFLAALLGLWDQFGDFLVQEPGAGAGRPQKRLWVTGHSLGGALATLAAWRCPRRNLDVYRTYTYAAPMIGNQAVADRFNAEFGNNLVRFVEPLDPVPLL